MLILWDRVSRSLMRLKFLCSSNGSASKPEKSNVLSVNDTVIYTAHFVMKVQHSMAAMLHTRHFLGNRIINAEYLFVLVYAENHHIILWMSAEYTQSARPPWQFTLQYQHFKRGTWLRTLWNVRNVYVWVGQLETSKDPEFMSRKKKWNVKILKYCMKQHRTLHSNRCIFQLQISK